MQRFVFSIMRKNFSAIIFNNCIRKPDTIFDFPYGIED